MNKLKVCGVFFFWCIVGVHVHGAIDPANTASQQKSLLPYIEGRLLVRTLPSVLDDALVDIESEMDAYVMRSYSVVPGLRLYEFDKNIPIEDAMNLFSNSGLVEYVEPDYVYSIASVDDPRFAEQWSLENTGQTGGVADADINVSALWEITHGDPNVVIGVIDTGIDYNHPDLVGNIWQNSGEIPGDGIDQDANGYIDDVYGANAIAGSGNPLDDNAHGTHVAGTIGAIGNNAVGGAGVMQTVKIAGCKFLGRSGSGSTSDAVECMQYFAALKSRAHDPVNLIATNNSWGSIMRSQALEDAIRTHLNLGILFVAAAGNSSANTDVTKYYPANYDLANLVAVAATDSSDRIANFSNFGRRSVHVGAPGVRILSTVLKQNYGSFSGTSMAAPHVVGMAGMIKARFPDYDFKQIKNLIISSGTPIASLTNTTLSGRRLRGADINGVGALTCVDQIVDSRMKPEASSVSLVEGQVILLSALRIKCSEPLGEITLYRDDQESVILKDSGENGDTYANDGVYSVLWRPTHRGNYALDFGNGDVVAVTVSTAPITYRNPGDAAGL